MDVDVKDQKGFSAVAAVLIVLIVALTGLAGWYVWVKNKSNSDSSTSTSNKATEKVETNLKTNDTSATKTFSSTGLNISFDYPSVWGSASEQSIPSEFSFLNASHKTVTFDKMPDVLVNLVTGPGGSPLDGCPAPVYALKHEVYLYNAILVGAINSKPQIYWDGTNDGGVPRVLEYWQSSMEISSKEKVTTFINKVTPLTLDYKTCGEDSISQADVDEYNSLSKHVRSVRNEFKNSKVFGINAYIANADLSDSKVAEVETLLISAK